MSATDSHERGSLLQDNDEVALMGNDLAERFPAGDGANEAHAVLAADGDKDLYKPDVVAVLPSHAEMLRVEQLGPKAERASKIRYRGSAPGRRGNKRRDFDFGLRNIIRDSFGIDGRPPVHSEQDFERRFRVPRSVFLRVFKAVKDEPEVKRTTNAAGMPHAHAMQRVVAAFRVLAYGKSHDRTNQDVRLSRSTIDTCCKKLMAFIVEDFGPDYLRPPTKEELMHILARNAQLGLPGCIDSIDCTN